MPVVHVLAHLAAAVLVLSGVAKVRRPTPMLAPLRRLRLPATRRAARALGVVEVAVGVAALTTSRVATVAALAALWLGLAVAAALLARDGSTDCGCFGEASRPVGPAHLVANAVASLAALASTLDPPPVPWALPDAPAVATAAYVVLLAAGAGAVSALLTAPPASRGPRRRPAPGWGRGYATTPRNEVPA